MERVVLLYTTIILYKTKYRFTAYQRSGKDDCSDSNSKQSGGDHFIRFWTNLSSDGENVGVGYNYVTIQYHVYTTSSVYAVYFSEVCDL